ncbi:MAG TPA: DUF1287 domain-containing protein [Pyrinomonadaceae bacterium]|jgi:hypothetical protein|nr:DUF1287 domain-containing protein [Pyrinomonadaceae bacterium]
MKSLKSAVAILLLLSFAGCRQPARRGNATGAVPPHPVLKALPQNSSPQLKQLIDGAVAQAGVTTGYDPSYVSIQYPGGDVPIDTGVCSDVLVRAFRKAGIDLQKEVHEDIERAWESYPKRWGLSAPDSNIDHRRVLNLMTYFTRQGKSIPITDEPDDYLPGDVVAWDLGGGVYHIGLVTNLLSETQRECLVVHNIGGGTRVEDVLMSWTIKGHYRIFN